MYDETITLFNRYHSNAGDTWYPTVIRGVNLTIDKASIVARYGENNENSAALHIKYQRDIDNDISIAGKKYREPKVWADLLNDDLGGYITFKTGNEGDFFITGDYGLEVIEDNAYTNGFLSYCRKKYDNVFVLTSVGRYDLIPHFEILGK